MPAGSPPNPSGGVPGSARRGVIEDGGLDEGLITLRQERAVVRRLSPQSRFTVPGHPMRHGVVRPAATWRHVGCEAWSDVSAAVCALATAARSVRWMLSAPISSSVFVAPHLHHCGAARAPRSAPEHVPCRVEERVDERALASFRLTSRSVSPDRSGRTAPPAGAWSPSRPCDGDTRSPSDGDRSGDAVAEAHVLRCDHEARDQSLEISLPGATHRLVEVVQSDTTLRSGVARSRAGTRTDSAPYDRGGSGSTPRAARRRML
jgi:hypothetical protein